MGIETNVFTFKIANTFEDQVQILDSPKLDQFHKSVGLVPFYS